MHSRNIFALNSPSFSDLANKYEKFRKCCYIGRGGKIRLDFKNPQAVCCLAETLLCECFQLNVSFNRNSLVPRIPQRLNYILLIQDLIILNNIENDVNGLDIGTGASCIYPLLGAKLFSWNFLCTEINASSIAWAKQNIKKNCLQNNIHIYQASENTIFEKLFMETDTIFTFSMCNPPFFDFDETEKRFDLYENYVQNHVARDFTKNTPNSFTIAKLNEICTEGGELTFVSQMIHDSFAWKTRVKIFTTMVGKKSSIKPLKTLLYSLCKDVKISLHTLQQGNTQRWIVAWSFYSSINLK